MDIREVLSGGDLRSVGHVDEVVTFVGNDPDRFSELMTVLTDDRPVVRMRSADAMEKVTRHYPALLQAHQASLFEQLQIATQQEVRWHLAQLMPRMTWTEEEASDIVRVLTDWIDTETSTIVIVNALQTMFDLSAMHPRFRDELKALLETQLAAGSPAVKSRAKKLLHKL
ncbi:MULTISPECIES: hypothetical protein [unclassified Exiguobacterium]|uniref:hypothetical protein n=1 Tax=unclassified Exiguobacterium TaxID=2644629 RepID=UPI00103DC050|nr:MULTISPECIES: hypothetical protein [unclassified Exiguobacterium]TCI70276.1 hypothetical protein EVJ19_08340 [Exiguobacterium sp. IPCI3]TCI79306.1 hypothetical protein EVJ18_08340 [Exiguobacterium sp. IPCH1]TCI81782.1 hypothetical protein EVJ17_08340 [Exiguobacterium sp. IPBC4]